MNRTTSPDRPFIPADLKIKAAKEFGTLQGHVGNHGGWIYGPNGTIAQGWHSYFGVRQAKILDHYTRKLTAFDSFAELLATDERYSPTIRPRTWRERFLADAFDRAAYDRKQSRRAWRGGEATPRPIEPREHNWEAEVGELRGAEQAYLRGES